MQEINDPRSVYYWAYKNNIPVFSPALTDGSIGDMIYFHSFNNPGLILDIAGDIRRINDEAANHKGRTGMLVLGGGVVRCYSLLFFSHVFPVKLFSESMEILD